MNERRLKEKLRIIAKYDERVKYYYEECLTMLEKNACYDLKLPKDYDEVCTHDLLIILCKIIEDSGFKVLKHYNYDFDNMVNGIEVRI